MDICPIHTSRRWEEKRKKRMRQTSYHMHTTPRWPSSESKGKQYGCHRNPDEAYRSYNRHTVHLISKATTSRHTCKVGDKALVCGSAALQQGHLSTHITPALMRQLKVSSTPLQSGMPSASPRDSQMSWLQRAAGLGRCNTWISTLLEKKVRKNILDI